MFAKVKPNTRFTFIVPTNHAWEKVKRDFSKVFTSLTDINNPDYVIFFSSAKLLPFSNSSH